ncbi:MAG: galactokinase family protein [Myxococcota bacterium]
MSESLDALRVDLAKQTGRAVEEIRSVVSPYRICPVGAHVDHQGGRMLGMAIDVSTQLVFVSSDQVDLESRNFPSRVEFDPGAPLPPWMAAPGGAPEMSPGSETVASGSPSWSRYVHASLETLRTRLPASPKGFRGIVAGGLPGGGLSSSASVLLAYFSAWAEVNSLSLSLPELVALAVEAENEYVGVQCGILDPASILGSRRDHLLSIDAGTGETEAIPLGGAADGSRKVAEPVFVVAFTGAERSLLSTPFNDRVEACFEAARFVASGLGADAPRANAPEKRLRLGDFAPDVLQDALDSIPGPIGKRARHFVEERARVAAAEEAWRQGDLAGLGELMSDSCRSSIENYETGSEELVALQEIWLTTPGVLGARFSGGGFGGCSLALVEPDAAEDVMESVARRFGAQYPGLRDRARTLRVKSADGLVMQ